MHRPLLAAIFIFGLAILGHHPSAFSQETKVDPVNEEASKLEAELGKYKDSSPEAAEVMIKLIDLYHQHGRVFGLVRAAERFTAAHPVDKRHQAVMLKLIDGQQALSRNQELAGTCRQFLARYPESPECAAIEIRLANTLLEMTDRLAAARGCEAVWTRSPKTAEGRKYGELAVAQYSLQGNKESVTRAAEICDSLLADAPSPIYARHIGYRGFTEWRRISEWAKANATGAKLLQAAAKTDPQLIRLVHRYMGDNYASLGQHANSAASFRQAKELEADYYVHSNMIVRLYHSLAKGAELAPLVAEYQKGYPDRLDRFTMQGYLALAYRRDEDKAKAMQLMIPLLSEFAQPNNIAGVVVSDNGATPEGQAKSEQVLLDAIKKTTRDADYLRYVLATNVYLTGEKNEEGARRMYREAVAQAPVANNYTRSAILWLLGNAPDDKTFQSEVALILKAQRENLRYRGALPYLKSWAQQQLAAKKPPAEEILARARFAQAEAEKFEQDPVIVAWENQFNIRGVEDAAARAQLLAPTVAKTLSDEDFRYFSLQQISYFVSYGPTGERGESVAVAAELAKRFPKDYEAALGYMQRASDYSQPEVAKEAALQLLKFPAEDGNPDHWRRLMMIVSRTKDAELAKQCLAWIQAATQKYGPNMTYSSSIGDALVVAGLEDEAVKYWQAYVNTDPNNSESLACADRLRTRIEDTAARVKFIQGLYAKDSIYHGRYATWLAAEQIAAGDLKGFEKTLRDDQVRHEQYAMLPWYLDETPVQSWVDTIGRNAERPEEDRRLVLSTVRDLEFHRPSATAQAALLSMVPEGEMTAIEKLLAYQRVTQIVGDASNDWDRLAPYAQAALARQDYLVAATLVTGMLANIPGANASRQDAGRDIVAQSYTRMGSVGLTIDEDSPIAPLMRAALYLRLGDERLAFDAYTKNKALFVEHQDKLPTDLILMVCERLMAAGGDDNLDMVEATLRNWIIKRSDQKDVDDPTKAEVQLLLARNYFKGQRYDVARGEFTTVIDRYAETPQAIEAQFGIGETFMAQKVFDQAEQVFDRLADSRDTNVVVRAEFLRGVLAFRRGDHDDARDIFRGVLERVPDIELANQTLFNLSEVYGAEERFIDQLNLLQTVGRLGRNSKRWHVPGMQLSIVVQDSDLGISRGHNKIPVRITTQPGGDQETIFLTSGGAGKGLFRADLNTQLGVVTAGNNVLELTGRDIIFCDYPDEFKAEFKNVPLSDAEIRVASNAKFEVASSQIVDEEERRSFTDELRNEGLEDPEAAHPRPSNQVKPGNQVYLRVTDPDRDLSDELDTIVVKAVADSGDQVQVTLTETGSHSGLFEASFQTGELPAGALASDTAIEHSPLMAIDQDRQTAWISEPDGATPKSLAVDLKDLRSVSRVQFSTPSPMQNTPLRGTLLGSYDGEFWFRMASNPQFEAVPPVAGEYAHMKRRVYTGNRKFTTWEQVVALTKNETPLEEAEVEELHWAPDETFDYPGNMVTIVWHGKLVQPRAGAARLVAPGSLSAIVIDGRPELELGPGNRTVDVWLEAGSHDLTIMVTVPSTTNGVTATIARANLSSAQVKMEPYRASDFDLEQIGAEPAPARALPTVAATDTTWEFGCAPQDVRYVKLVVEEYLGEAVAINHVEIAGPGPDQLYIPTKADVLALAGNNTLEIAAGDTINVTYTDEFTSTGEGRSQLLNQQLTATYFNADIQPITYEFNKVNGGGVSTVERRLMRVDPGERLIVQITDYDSDLSPQPDTLEFEVAVNNGEPIKLTATETSEFSGVFTKEVDTAAGIEEGKLTVKPGDRIICRFIDRQNTFPGHSVPRETVVYVNQPAEAIVRVLETRLLTNSNQPNAVPRPQYQTPEEGKPISGVAFELPLTVEVIDPDQAKNAGSSLVVRVATTDGAEVDVRCVVSGKFADNGANATDTLALEQGRFIGQVIMQLGGKDSPRDVPLTAEMPRFLTGGPAVGEGEADLQDANLVARVINLTGKDVLNVTYNDALRPAGGPVSLDARGRLISNGQLAVTDREYEQEVELLHVGEKLFLRVIDADKDTSDERDFVKLEITGELGEKEEVQLEETLAHSGIFTGSLLLKAVDQPTAGNLSSDDPIIETYFGDKLSIRFLDETASTATGTLELTRELPVVIGTNGLVSAFSKAFNDENLAVETKFHIAESYFELFKSHRKLERGDAEKTDLEAGRRVLTEVMEDYPNPKYVPRVAYLLGQFAQELEQWNEAIRSYEVILKQYADHPLAPDAQYKLAQCYEEADNFPQALDAYVTLAATYPKSPLISSVMIRICDHFYKENNFEVAAQVGEKFLERFDSHEHSPRLAFRVGQCYYKSKGYKKAGDAFDQFAKKFPDDALGADALFWSGESYRLAKDNRTAFIRYNRCRNDFPESEAAKYARGRLALPEMLREFENYARSIDE